MTKTPRPMSSLLREAKGLLEDAHTYVVFHVKDKDYGHVAEELCRKIDHINAEIDIILLNEHLAKLDDLGDGD